MKLLNMIVACVAGVSVILACVGGAAAQTATETRQESNLTASGTAKVYRTPDYVDVTTGILSQETTASAAQASASGTMGRIVGAIRELKLPGADLQTGSVELAPRYESRQYSEDPRKIIGYTATITVRIRTTDVNTVSKIIDTAIGAGANRVEGVQFGIKEAIEAREEAIALATKAARRKAEVMATALDMRLGRLIQANASTNQSGWWGANRFSNESSNLVRNSSGGGSEAGDDATSVVPGKVEVWAEATVTFGVADKGK